MKSSRIEGSAQRCREPGGFVGQKKKGTFVVEDPICDLFPPAPKLQMVTEVGMLTLSGACRLLTT